MFFSLDNFIPLEVTADLTLYNHPQGQVRGLTWHPVFFNEKKKRKNEAPGNGLGGGTSEVEQRVHFVSKQPGSVKVGHLVVGK